MLYTFAACCACNGSGQAAAEPRIKLMKSRRRTGPSPGSERRQSARSLADWDAAVRRVGPNPMSALGHEQTSRSAIAMSALGHKQTYAAQQVMSALPPIATAKADSGKGAC